MIKRLFEGNKDIGILILRVGMGTMFIWHGAPKIFGGPQYWEGLGKAMGNLGIHFLPIFWGFLAAFAEFFGGIMIVLGFITPLAAALLAFNMFVATMFHFGMNQGLAQAAHPITAGIVFLSLIFLGAGKYSVDYYLVKKKLFK